MTDQPKIISASRRTDIPAFYSSWFMNRIREGFAIYPNPLFPGKTYRVDLRPQAVNGIVFWTRYPEPLMPYLKELDDRGYAYYFLISILNYPREIEPFRPSIGKTIQVVRKLSQTIGPDRVIWRYDPVILIPETTGLNFHIENFSWLVEQLSGVTEKVIVSIVDPYQKTVMDLKIKGQTASFDPDDYQKLLTEISLLAQKAGLILQSCAEPLMDISGIVPGRCVDAELIQTLSGLKTAKQQHIQRKGCLCQKSVDIGVTNTCLFGCRYCYATSDFQRARANYQKHDPHSPVIMDAPGSRPYRKCHWQKS